MAMKRMPNLPAQQEAPRIGSALEAGDKLTLDGQLFKVVYQARGPWICVDDKPEVAGIGFLGVVPE
jgi:hypothetical protein